MPRVVGLVEPRSLCLKGEDWTLKGEVLPSREPSPAATSGFTTPTLPSYRCVNI